MDDKLEFLIDSNLENLVQSMDAKPLALIGAGLSVASGFPHWNGLLADLEKHIQSTPSTEAIPPKFFHILREIGDPAWHAEELLRRMGKTDFDWYIRETFRSPPRPPIAHTAVTKLGFRHFLTTNYDPCIELALAENKRIFEVTHWSESSEVSTFFNVLSNSNSTPHIVYLHGRYDRPESIILTESSYRRYLDENFNRKLVAIFMTHPIIFIGFSMADPELSQLMRIARTTMRAGTATHFGIFGYRTIDERELISRRMLEKYGVKAIFYKIKSSTEKGDDHSSIINLLGYIYEKTIGETNSTDFAIDDVRSYLNGSINFSSQSDYSSTSDPNKGNFGRKSISNERQLRIDNIKITEKTFISFSIVCESLNKDHPLVEHVDFYLHPTFKQPKYRVNAKKNRAALDIEAAYGAFTIGAVADSGKTRLELDLCDIEYLPKWFRER